MAGPLPKGAKKPSILDGNPNTHPHLCLERLRKVIEVPDGAFAKVPRKNLEKAYSILKDKHALKIKIDERPSQDLSEEIYPIYWTMVLMEHIVRITPDELSQSMLPLIPDGILKLKRVDQSYIDAIIGIEESLDLTPHSKNQAYSVLGILLTADVSYGHGPLLLHLHPGESFAKEFLGIVAWSQRAHPESHGRLWVVILQDLLQKCSIGTIGELSAKLIFYYSIGFAFHNVFGGDVHKCVEGYARLDEDLFERAREEFPFAANMIHSERRSGRGAGFAEVESWLETTEGSRLAHNQHNVTTVIPTRSRYERDGTSSTDVKPPMKKKRGLNEPQ